MMNEYVKAKRREENCFKPGGDCEEGYDDAKPQYRALDLVDRTTSSASLPWMILEMANFFFSNKGFEDTTIPDICAGLEITRSQFFSYFDSLDEVLEILWAR